MFNDLWDLSLMLCNFSSDFIYLLSRKEIIKKSQSTDLDYQIQTLRLTLIALIISIVWLLFNPIWFPQAKLKYDFMRIFLLFVALFAVFTTYIVYKKKLKYST